MSFIPAIIGVIAAMVAVASRMHKCPECNLEAERFRLPRNLKQALRGGWICPHCKAEMDRHGKTTPALQ